MILNGTGKPNDILIGKRKRVPYVVVNAWMLVTGRWSLAETPELAVTGSQLPGTRDQRPGLIG